MLLLEVILLYYTSRHKHTDCLKPNLEAMLFRYGRRPMDQPWLSDTSRSIRSARHACDTN